MPRESEIAGLHCCVVQVFHHLIKLNVTVDMSVSQGTQGKNLNSEFLTAWLGQDTFQDTDLCDEAASVSHPTKLCNLLVWKTVTLVTPQSAAQPRIAYPCADHAVDVTLHDEVSYDDVA